MLQPGIATPAARVHPATQPAPLRPVQDDASTARRKPIWDKNNVGFWLTACILASLVFSIAWRAIG
ncbi:hypothetical protein [Frateuria sp. STR12]|uniref:hypothetical protein n=1 Tax=Frateuria hangzhouensis TaxID=2995589 RepID=UPI002260B55F|nr:hypothetical protein [Frateuria sp. STR12]MCX7514129.1 hypothetical protein [Frateuria sp. STR12]